MKQRCIGAQGYLRSLSSPSPWAVLALSGAVLVGSSCQKESPKPEPASTPPTAPAPAAVAATPTPTPSPAAKPLEWDDPPQWKKVTPSSAMRKASYEIPPAKGDGSPGELNVFILGGEIEPNIKRWLDEFSGFDLKTIVRHDRMVNDMTQAVVEVPKGTFSGGMASKNASANYGLLGAIVVTPSGAQYFFKLTGPAATLQAARDTFYEMLDSMRLEGGTREKPPATPATTPAAKASASAASPPTPAAPAHAPAAPAAHAAPAHPPAAPAAH